MGRAFVRLADTLVDEYDVIDLLDRLAGYCVELLAAQAAAIMLVDPRGVLRVAASTSEDAEFIELLQLQNEQGPCVECFHSARVVGVANLRDAISRWPRFAAAAIEHSPFVSVHAVPLRLRGESIGALNLFGVEAGELPSADLALGQALADVATIGILQERAIRRGEVLSEQLQVALNSRVIIEQAKGVLAQETGLTVAAAFDMLRGHARATNQRLTEVARRIVDRELSAAGLRPGRRREQGNTLRP
jgi:GAF domain-containing protein